MTLVAITFVLSLSLMLGAYWLFIVRSEGQSKASVVGRLKKYKSETKSVSVVLAPTRLSTIPFLEHLLKGRQGITSRVQMMLVESGLKWTVGTLLLACFVGGALGAVVGWKLLHLFVAAAILAALGMWAPYFYVRFKRRKRLELFEEQFPEAMDLISRALRAGHAFSTGLGMVAEEVPAPVGSEFRRLYDEQNFGMSLQDAMRAMAGRVPVLDAKFFVTAVLTQRETGGNLSEVLDNLASVMRDRFKLKRQMRVITAHGRISAWVLSCMPPALAFVLFLLSPQFMNTLITDPWGIQLMLVAGVLQVIGTIIISRLVKLDY